MASVAQKRELVIRLTSNRLASEKEVYVEPYFPLVEDLKGVLVTRGGLQHSFLEPINTGIRVLG